MSTFKLPAPNAHASEWGALAVSIPGWPWMPGMLGYNDYGGTYRIMDHSEASQINADLTPDPDDPATAGCLLALLSVVPTEGYMAHVIPPSSTVTQWRIHMNTARTGPTSAYGTTLGRACIAAAEALGRWPGGEE